MITPQTLDFDTALALYEWQREMGADEPVGEEPVNRYELAAEAVKVASRMAEPAAPPVAPAAADPVELARAAAAAATALTDLAERQAAYDRCDLKKGARNFVFADGTAGARVMIIGEAPGRDEDLQGRPFVGLAGQMLDRMFAAIGMSRRAPDTETGLYITNVMPWRPPANRDPEAAEIAMMLPFLARHVELADPELIVLMGNISCMAALGRNGIMGLRGKWTTAFGKPALPMTHPAYLLRTPSAKREAWADLLEIKARLGGKP